MEMGTWVMVMALGGALASALGWWYDRAHRPTRAYLLTLTRADGDRARCMSHYYATVRAPEW